MASTFSADLNCGAVDDSMGCLGDKLLGESLRPEVYSASIEGFNCEDRGDSSFFHVDKFMIESMIAVAVSVVSGGLSCRDDDEFVVASNFSVELNLGDIESTM